MKRSYPLVFCRGIARFDILRDKLTARLKLPDRGLADEVHYFRGIKSFLSAHGYTVYHTSVGFADGVDERAWQLARQVKEILAAEKVEKVHLIAHSMGGNDARHMLVDVPGMAERTASLTTIGAPHLGTSLADLVLERGGQKLIDRLFPYIHLDGFRDLTLEACARFNERAVDREVTNAVRYRTYASAQKRKDVFLPLQLGSALLSRTEGENDGLVSLRSQQWYSELRTPSGRTKKIVQKKFPFPADHLNECGWWEPGELEPGHGKLGDQIQEFDDRIRAVYLEIADTLQNMQ
ncbi:MAG: esterase/lipase family protein [Rudaea sp.]